MAVGEREVIEVGAAGFGDPQCVESEEARQDVVVAAGEAGLDKERAEFAAVQPNSLRSSPRRVDSGETFGRRTCTAGEWSISCSSTQ